MAKKKTQKVNESKFFMTPKQTLALGYLQDNITDELLLTGSAGSAKTTIAIFWAVKYALMYKGFVCGIVRRFISESMVTIMESLDEVLDLQGIPKSIYAFDKTTNVITFQNGSKFMLISGNVTSSDKSSKLARLGGIQLTALIIDECSLISKFFVDIIRTRVRFIPQSMKEDENLDYRFKKIYITNPDISSWIYPDWILPHQAGTLQYYRKIIHSTVNDNPHMSPAYRDDLNRLPKTERDRLYLGLWVSQSNDELIPLDTLNRMFVPIDYSQYPATHISCDVAYNGANADYTVIMVWSNFFLVDLYYHKDKNLVENAKLIKELMAKHTIGGNNVYIDSDGLGKGLVDMVPGSYPIINISPALNKENYKNLKAQLYYKVRENAGEIRMSALNIPTEIIEQIKQEFAAIDAIIIGDDKWDVTSKVKVREKLGGKSPDFSDCIAYSMLKHFKSKNSGIYHLI